MPLNKTCCTGNCDQGRSGPQHFAQNYADGGAATDTHSLRNCNDLGVCQSRSPACADCKPKQPRHYFAPGVINGGSSDLQLDNNRWVFTMTWREYVAATVAVAIVMGIAGWLK
jgi:hypothetical protein